MVKKVVLAVAGSGKTSLIVDSLNLDERALLITYTENNLKTLKRRIIKKFGGFPDNIKLYSYFTFLYSFCYKPHLAMEIRARGINWDTPPFWTMRKPRNDIKFYMDGFGRIYHNRIAKLLDQQGVVDDVNRRLEKYFDCIFVDEVQDLGGHDFNLLNSICQANIEIVLVGDYFQHTFDTSRDGNVNKTLYDDQEKYVARLEKMGLTVDRETLKNSYRCSPTVCKFISEAIGIEINSHRSDDSTIMIVDDENLVEKQFNCDDTVKLFYAEHYKYPCYSQNWGASKGQDHYENVCVLLSQKNYSLLQEGNLRRLNPQTRNKLYVACSRARNDLYLVCQKHVRKHKVH